MIPYFEKQVFNTINATASQQATQQLLAAFGNIHVVVGVCWSMLGPQVWMKPTTVQ